MNSQNYFKNPDENFEFSDCQIVPSFNIDSILCDEILSDEEDEFHFHDELPENKFTDLKIKPADIFPSFNNPTPFPRSCNEVSTEEGATRILRGDTMQDLLSLEIGLEERDSTIIETEIDNPPVTPILELFNENNRCSSNRTAHFVPKLSTIFEDQEESSETIVNCQTRLTDEEQVVPKCLQIGSALESSEPVSNIAADDVTRVHAETEPFPSQTINQCFDRCESDASSKDFSPPGPSNRFVFTRLVTNTYRSDVEDSSESEEEDDDNLPVRIMDSCGCFHPTAPVIEE